MKILAVSNFYPPRIFGGYELYLEAIVKGLRKKGHDIYILTSQGNYREAEEYVFPLFTIKIDNFYKTSQTGALKKAVRFFINPRNFFITRDIIRKVNPDIISIWNLRLISISPILASSLSGKPTVFHIYDPWLLPLRFFKPLCRFLSIKNVVTCTRSLALQYEAIGVRKEYLTVIPHGIPVYPRISLDRALSNGKKVLIVSSLSKEKGIDIALKAMAILVNKKKRRDFSLDIYGEGDESYDSELKSILEKEGIESYVSFKGRIEPGLLDGVFSRYDIFISPERWATLPMVLLQAMANGMPAIGTDYTGMDEAIESGVNGLLVPPEDPSSLADALELLDRDKSLRMNLGLKARETVIEKFNIERDIDKIEDYYFNLIKK